MKITRTSPFSGQVNTLDIPVTSEQITEWQNGKLIQDAMPNLTPDEREFILTGITAQEWEDAFGNGDFDEAQEIIDRFMLLAQRGAVKLEKLGMKR